VEPDGEMEFGNPEPGGETDVAGETVVADDPGDGSVLGVCAQDGAAASVRAKSGQILRHPRIISGPSRL
jgi:hypothetical protein